MADTDFAHATPATLNLIPGPATGRSAVVLLGRPLLIPLPALARLRAHSLRCCADHMNISRFGAMTASKSALTP
jgi:hypothetical protein